jgi:mono/diheme cytochrome c family protein
LGNNELPESGAALLDIIEGLARASRSRAVVRAGIPDSRPGFPPYPSGAIRLSSPGRVISELFGGSRNHVPGTTMTTAHHQHSAHPLRSLVFFVTLVVIGLMLSASRPAAQSFTDGEEVFARVCATCHQVDPPADMQAQKPIAPPMKMIVRRYMMVNESEEAAHARIVAWLQGPSADKSIMPPMAIEEHGLMPPVVLTEEERTAVASYVLSLHEAGMPGMGQMKGMDHSQMGQMNGEGQGMQHQHGQQMNMEGGMTMDEGMKCEHMQQKAGENQ